MGEGKIEGRWLWENALAGVAEYFDED